MMSNAIQDKCPKCGKYQPKEANGYYAPLICSDGSYSDEIRVFCNEQCWESYQGSKALIPDSKVIQNAFLTRDPETAEVKWSYIAGGNQYYHKDRSSLARIVVKSTA